MSSKSVEKKKVRNMKKRQDRMEAMVEVLMSKFDQMCCNLIFDPMFFLNIFIIKKSKNMFLIHLYYFQHF